MNSPRLLGLIVASIGSFVAVYPFNATAGEDSRRNIPQTSSTDQILPEWRESDGVKVTTRDWAGAVSKYYGQRRDQQRDTERQIAKVDFDADLNYDGVISNEDPADGGAFQRTPPGLVVGVGELAKAIVRITPYRVDYGGEAVVSLEVVGINRSVRSGEFASFEEEAAQTSRVRVWKDAEKRVLLLDSHDPARRRVEWTLDNARLALGGAITGMNLPNQDYPRRVYIEGVRPHGSFIGDVRLLLAVEHRSIQDSGESKPKVLERFRTSWNTMLVTVTPQPLDKEYVVSEALQDIWITPGRPTAVTRR
jgi:hypothetical protein